MSNQNLIEETSIFNTTALFSKDKKSRYLLKFSWDSEKKKLAIIMTFPSTAGVELLDQTTMLVRNGAVKNGFGEVAVLNLFPNINSDTPKADKQNTSIILSECEKADTVIVAYGRTLVLRLHKYRYFLQGILTHHNQIYPQVPDTSQSRLFSNQGR